MRFKLRTLFIAIYVVAMICGFAVFIEQSWVGPERVGRQAQDRLNAVFAKYQWQGYAGTWHYDYRVRIVSSDIGDDEIKKLYPILRDIPWLRYIELGATSMTDGGVADMKREFPQCVFLTPDQWF